MIDRHSRRNGDPRGQPHPFQVPDDRRLARTDIGIALGVASIPLGVGAAADATVAGLSGFTLFRAAFVTGTAAGLADYPACFAGDAAACLGGGLGLAGVGFSLGGPALGFFGAFLGLNGAALDLVLGSAGAVACW